MIQTMAAKRSRWATQKTENQTENQSTSNMTAAPMFQRITHGVEKTADLISLLTVIATAMSIRTQNKSCLRGPLLILRRFAISTRRPEHQSIP